MKTLADYVKGYPYVQIIEVARHVAKNGDKYYLCKQPGYDNFYFMKGDEVLDSKNYSEDKFPALSIKHLNNKKDQDVINEIKKCLSYKAFAKFIKQQTGEEFTL